MTELYKVVPMETNEMTELTQDQIKEAVKKTDQACGELHVAYGSDRPTRSEAE